MEEHAKKFIEYELKIKELNDSIKVLKQEKENTSELLKHCMSESKTDYINIDGYIINLRNYKQYGSLNKEYIESALSTFCKKPIPNDSKVFAEKATEHVFSNRETTEKKVIRLCKSKK